MPSRLLSKSAGGAGYFSAFSSFLAAAGTLRRYDGLPISPPPMVALAAGTPSRLIARDVTGCTFTTRPGNSDHGGLLLIRVTVSRVTNGVTDSLRVMKQLKVEDAA